MGTARDVSSMMRCLANALSDEQVSNLQTRWNDKNTIVPLKVATVCSGTDAPILALELLISVLKSDKNVNNIEMQHVFSCESVPFKRDFIVQTTNPPLLFTDVTQLASGSGTCHDGKVRNVPDNFHFLIAGTECVDFSSLSTTPKGLHNKNGRSAITFHATLALVKVQRPPLVLLENVAKCPVQQMEEAFEGIGYRAAHVKVGTSDYFLPQSRNRTYFVFAHTDCTQRVANTNWAQIMKQLGSERPRIGETTLGWTDFLRTDNGRALSTTSTNNKKRKRGKPLAQSQKTKWLAEINRIETAEGLTPYHQEGGRPYSGIATDAPLVASLPDRAKMRLDVQFKRAVKAGIDPMTTPLLWNPAQQLRFTDAQPWLRTIAPCVTPKHEWIVSCRRAPLTGRECLDLQGIPISDHVAQLFDDRKLRDLAGNAMSTTVVAAAFLAALVSFEIVEANDGRPEEDS